MPLADQLRAQALHFVRLVKLEVRLSAAIPVTLFADAQTREAAERRVEKIAELRTEAQERLDQMLGR